MSTTAISVNNAMPDAVTLASYKSLPGPKKSRSDQTVDLTDITTRPASPVKLGPSLSRTTSPSSSEYSCDSDTPASSRTKGNNSNHSRRASALSDVGSDRRRLAIVQMEAVHEGRSKSASDSGHNPRLRRAGPNLTGVAIVAPPDASPSTYTHLSPPLPDTTFDHVRSTQRTESKQYSRSVKSQKPCSQPRVTGSIDDRHSSKDPSLPSIQPSNIRSSASSSSANLHSPSVDHPLTTPPIGQSKDIHTPVAGPVVVNLEPSRPLNISKVRTQPSTDAPAITAESSTDSSGRRGDVLFVHYLPGLHATAGPLPPPPRATFAIDPSSPPPPRPPRTPHPPRSRADIETVKQALQLPPAVSATLASRFPGSSSELSSPSKSVRESSTPIEEGVDAQPLHRREGAFVPTPELGNDQIPLSLVRQDLGQKDTNPNSMKLNEHKHLLNIEERDADEINVRSNIVIVAPPPRNDSLCEHDSFSNLHPETTSSPEPSSQKPSPPPKSFRNSLTMSLKRFSQLPPPPSIPSRSGNRSSVVTIRTSRTPSPSYPIQRETATQSPRHKIITQNPPALFCHEVHSSKSALERCSIYAQKINELYNCDTGLVVWLHDTKYRGNTSAAPSTDPFAPQRRHTSGSSMMTEATFPLRPDATTATDLTNSHRNITPPSVQPPPLPYPSLAISQQRRLPPSTPTSSIRSFATSTPTSTLKGAIFASLGRRTSVTTGWREKPGITALSPTNSQSGGSSGRKNVLTKPQQSPYPRAVNVTTSPSVPGGPRAPPNRIKRSQTLMATPAPFSTKPEAERAERQSTNHFVPDHIIDIKPDPEFTRQVDRLADLLPHVDRNILAAYLRRAGQDILAIGQYLEDEKNGTIQAE